MRDIHEAILELKPGAFFRLGFISEVPTNKEWKKNNEGCRLVKVSEVTTRTGVFYGNLVDRGENSSSSKTSNYSPIIRNKVVYNSNTEKEYLSIYPTNTGKNSKVYYAVLKNNKEVEKFSSKNKIENMTIPSYFNKKKSAEQPKIIRINLDNIFKINNEVW